MPDRKDKRVTKKFIVSMDNEGFERLGLTKNLSKSGLCVDAETKVLSNREIILSIAAPGEIYNLKGEVVWCTHSDVKNDNVPESLGIKIIEAPAEYLNFVEYIKHQGITPSKPEF